MEISGRAAVVTGGASGIGQAVARRIYADGGNVIIFDLNAEAGAAMVEEMGADRCLFAQVNVADEASVEAGIDAGIEKFGAIYAVVNCAGIASASRTVGRDGAFPLDLWDKVIAVNLTGTFNVIRLCAVRMQHNEPVDKYMGRGVIINTASVAAYEGQMGQAAYSATKGGIVGMTLPIARDLSKIGIRVNTIAPGMINTPLFAGLPQDSIDSLSAAVLYPQRLGTPEEIGKLAAANIDNDYINGETIRMDGGIRMQPR
jgi:3-hydroxyacyl-CoA dehydrogenase/3-hydroxy-2-methylbutyryl-CoA dehydrogenase